MTVTALLAASAMLAWGASRADATTYWGTEFCNASSSHSYSVYLAPGQRCVDLQPIRAQLMAVTNEGDGVQGIGNLIDACIVGKQYSGGTGGNTYPLACGVIGPGEGVWGPNVDASVQPTSWPTIINNSTWRIAAWMHGTKFGFWP